jgi:DNA-directed RNA polymerase specialized sigma24 family protein
MAVHEALDRLAEKSPRKAELVKLRYFLGCTIPEAAQILGIARNATVTHVLKTNERAGPVTTP